VRNAKVDEQAGVLKAWGNGLPFAWPHDALSHDRNSGDTFAEIYRRAGLNMLWERAALQDGTWGVEATVALMQERMDTGRFKVFSHLSDWFEEFRTYHRKDGRIVKEGDDLMSASRYALMMLRFAKTIGSVNGSGPIKRNLRGIV
jgi:hypothetical protein